MYKNKNESGSALLIVVLLLAIFGVGAFLFIFQKQGGFNKKSTSTDTVETVATKPISAPLESGPVKLVIATHWGFTKFQVDGIYEDGALKSKGLRQYLDEYTKLHPNVTFEIKSILFNELYDKLRLMHDTDTAPDIYFIHSQWAPSYVAKGMLDTPPASVVADVKTSYVSTDSVTVDGKVWGYPTEINDYVLLYNKKLFSAAGINNPPTTWDELVKDAIATTKTQNSKITQYGFAFLKDDIELTGDPFLALLYSNGGQFVTSDYKQSVINSPEGVQALTAMTDLFKSGTTDINASFYDFSKGKVAMVIAPPWIKNKFKQDLGSNFDSTVGLASIPGLRKTATLEYGWFGGVMAKSKYKNTSWDFLTWMAAEVQPETKTTRLGDLLANTIGAIPTRTVDINNEAALKDFFTSFYVKQLATAKSSPNLLQYDDMRTIMVKEIQSAFLGTKSPKDALDTAATKINAILGTHYK